MRLHWAWECMMGKTQDTTPPTLGRPSPKPAPHQTAKGGAGASVIIGASPVVNGDDPLMRSRAGAPAAFDGTAGAMAILA